MNTEQDQGVRYHVLKTAVGATIMKVELKDNDKFLQLYGDQVLASGITLAAALKKTQWEQFDDSTEKERTERKVTKQKGQ